MESSKRLEFDSGFDAQAGSVIAQLRRSFHGHFHLVAGDDFRCQIYSPSTSSRFLASSS